MRVSLGKRKESATGSRPLDSGRGHFPPVWLPSFRDRERGAQRAYKPVFPSHYLLAVRSPKKSRVITRRNATTDRLFCVRAVSAAFDCPKENGFFAHDRSCDKYWKCEDGRAELKVCGNGLAFDDTDAKFQRENCDYIYNVDCGDRDVVGTTALFSRQTIGRSMTLYFAFVSRRRAPNQHSPLPSFVRRVRR